MSESKESARTIHRDRIYEVQVDFYYPDGSMGHIFVKVSATDVVGAVEKGKLAAWDRAPTKPNPNSLTVTATVTLLASADY